MSTPGALYVYGFNNYGELGLGSETVGTEIPTLTRVGNDSNWLKVERGPFHALAIKSDGSLWATGNNEYGQLGLGDTVDRHVFTLVDNGPWVDIEAGYLAGASYSFGVKANGTLWGWGKLTYIGYSDSLVPYQFPISGVYSSVYSYRNNGLIALESTAPYRIRMLGNASGGGYAYYYDENLVTHTNINRITSAVSYPLAITFTKELAAVDYVTYNDMGNWPFVPYTLNPNAIVDVIIVNYDMYGWSWVYYYLFLLNDGSLWRSIGNNPPVRIGIDTTWVKFIKKYIISDDGVVWSYNAYNGALSPIPSLYGLLDTIKYEYKTHFIIHVPESQCFWQSNSPVIQARLVE